MANLTTETATGDYTWSYWNLNYTTSATTEYMTTSTNSTGATVWYCWNAGYWKQVEETAEQTRQREAAREAARVAAAAEREAQAKLQAEADARAEALLKANLSESQRKEFAKTKSFTVVSKSGERSYLIKKGWSHNVVLIEKKKQIATLCAHPSVEVPHYDNMLAQKMMLEHAEESFLKIANRNNYATA